MQNVLENFELSLKVFNPSCKNERTISIPCWAIGVALVYAATDGAIKEARRSVAAMSKLSEADAVKLLATSYGGLKTTNGAIDYSERASSQIWHRLLAPGCQIIDCKESHHRLTHPPSCEGLA